MTAKHSLPTPRQTAMPPGVARRDPHPAPPWRFADWAAI